MPDSEISALRSRVDDLTNRLAKASATLSLVTWVGGAVGVALVGALVAGQFQISDVTGAAGEADELARNAQEAAVAARTQLNEIETRLSGLADAAVATAIGGLDGMIAVFGENGCPSGWRNFDDGAGRVIVGLGEGLDVNGNPLTERDFGETGGEEQVQLTIPQMPSHNHGGATGSTDQEVAIPDGNGFGRVGPDGTMLILSTSTVRPLGINSQGGDQPHNNMPPYIALHFCEYVGVTE